MHNLFSAVREIYGFPLLLPKTNKFEEDKFPPVEEAWQEYWKPTMIALGSLCRDSRPAVRDLAFIELQRAALNPAMYTIYPVHWNSFFDKVLFPLLTEYITPKEIRVDRLEQLEMLRLHGVQHLSKVFLQHLPTLGSLPWQDFKSLWMKILHIISMYMNESSENLKDALKESLKNIILVMSVSGLFKKNEKVLDAQQQQEQDLWELSWSWINAVCPSLQEELMTPVVPNEAENVGPSQEPQQNSASQVVLPENTNVN